jgi:hypothetical protein
MKRVFTLFVAAGLFIAADAQPQHRRPQPPVQVTVGDTYHSGSFAADHRLRAEIFRINNRYDRKIERVRRSYYMRPAVKAGKIRSLEMQRQRELDQLFRQFGRNHRYDYPNRRY